MIIYYGYSDNSFSLAPTNALSWALNNDPVFSKNKDMLHHRCPAFTDFYKNTFAVFSPDSYKIEISDQGAYSEMYDQAYFNENVLFRGDGVVSYLQPRLFLYAEKPVDIELFAPTYSSTANQDLVFISGKYNIGKHFRKLEAAVVARKSTTWEINPDSPLYYVRVLTDEKVQFKRYAFNDELHQAQHQLMVLRDHCRPSKIKPLSFYYERAKQTLMGDRILKTIKNNLME